MTLKERTAAISLAASLLLAIVKLGLGLAIGSLALVTDALHSATDFLATTITLLAVRWGDRPPDESHPYGHAKFESVAALGEATLLLLLAGGVTVEAVRRLRADHDVPDISFLPVAVLLVEIAINTWRARALLKVGRETKSPALQADALHFASDVYSSLAVLAGFGLIVLGFDWGDSAATLAVAALIAILALRLLRRTVDELVDSAPAGVARTLEARTLAQPGVVGVEFVRLRAAGAQHFVDIGIQVARSLNVEEAAAVKERVVATACDLLGKAEVLVQSVPVSPSDETIHDRVLLVALRERVAVHHVTVHHVGDALAIAVDVEVDGRLSLAEAHAVADRLEDAIQAEFGEGTEIETHIEPLAPEVHEAEPGSEALRAAFEAALHEAANASEGVSEIHNVRLRRAHNGYVLVAHCRLDPHWTVDEVHRRVDDLERTVRERRPEIARIIIHAEPRGGPDASSD
ncbi:cation-efflux pump [Faunimonas sp. B44]|uniref:cation-efflux pump n=1 Tax=Faunimonas sp. B44 TaxID=3461493 RepID=UPI0040450B15